ncbi:hypothetical protein NCCP2716_01910 [Sporosarcina sp. NCCP-2716]|uniref:glycerophosphodiester phosphodiesterase n=1 Tax=Sporosarcina sp. NCCP-2716 TaxID=2943679 RepID=UPI00204216DC|nr:glycerophosphodiester phosphodiesterase [Sporosarcina sp. NCCP-2716]GKV67693.1 hypothetical protein NCCP2716_01910 [Sporosarcina sp. NCCP-2716]
MGKKTKVALSVGAAGAAAWAASKALIRPAARDDKQALQFEGPVVLQQLNGPEESLRLAESAAASGAHGLAMDIRLTPEEEIVLGPEHNADSHDPLLLRDLLQAYPHLLFVVRLVDSPDTYEGSLMPSKLWKLLEECSAQDHVAVISAYDEQVDRFNLYTQNRAAAGAGREELKQAYAAYTSRFGHLYKPRSDFFVLSGKLGPFQPANEGFIQFLQKLNIAVYLDNAPPETVVRLARAGVSGFLTADAAGVIGLLEPLTE